MDLLTIFERQTMNDANVIHVHRQNNSSRVQIQMWKSCFGDVGSLCRYVAFGFVTSAWCA